MHFISVDRCSQIMSSILLPTFCLKKLDIAFNFFLFSKSVSTTKEEIYMLFSFWGNKLNEIKNQVKGFLKVLDKKNDNLVLLKVTSYSLLLSLTLFILADSYARNKYARYRDHTVIVFVSSQQTIIVLYYFLNQIHHSTGSNSKQQRKAYKYMHSIGIVVVVVALCVVINIIIMSIALSSSIFHLIHFFLWSDVFPWLVTIKCEHSLWSGKGHDKESCLQFYL